MCCIPNVFRIRILAKNTMYDSTFKIFLLGDAGCGKTTLTQRFLTNLFISDVLDQTMTIGVNFEVKSLSVDDRRIFLQIWEFGDEERFKFLLPPYIRSARGVLFLYDITNYSSIAHIDDWLSYIKKGTDYIFPIILIGCKADLVENREVSAADAIKIAKSRNLNGFIETSSKTGENVEKAFRALSRLMLDDKLKKEKPEIKKKGIKISTKERRKKKETKDEEYLITYTRHLEKRLRNLETEKQLLDAERLRSEQELHSLRNEIDRLREPPLVVAVIVSINKEKRKATVVGSAGPLYVVSLSRKVLHEKLEPGMIVAINQRTFAIMDILSITKEEIQSAKSKLYRTY